MEKMTELEIIKAWKTNERGWAYLPEEMREFANSTGRNKFILLTENGYEPTFGADWCKSVAYRLPADYPEPSEKKGRWVEWRVKWLKNSLNKMAYMAEDPQGNEVYIHLDEVTRFKGFAGIQYRAENGELSKWSMCPLFYSACEFTMTTISADDRPTTPVKVRFWIED